MVVYYTGCFNSVIHNCDRHTVIYALAYGACADWMFSVMGGIQPDELYPGYERCVIAPVPNPSLSHFKASYKSNHGEIVSSWRYEVNTLTYNITTPVRSKIIINGTVHEVDAGSYEFTSEV